MKYQSGKRRRAAEYEKALVEWWKKSKTFEKSVEQRSIDDSYVFYDGPPFITGMPHHGTLLSSIVKDAVPRYWTMRGKRVERRWGWDCHGLPAENFVEKQLGITDRREIGTKWSLEDYILKARESMVANSETWEGTIDRIGRWVDFKGAYRTMDKNFMESVWWAFKKLYDAGKIYEGRKVLMYDTKFATPVSKSEVTMDNDAYQSVTDPSAFVKFALSPRSTASNSPVRGSSTLSTASLRASNPPSISSEIEANFGLDEFLKHNEETVYLLAWTTTPWTLPANMALAVNPEMEYVAVRTATSLASSSSADALLSRRTSSTSRSVTPASSNKPNAEATMIEDKDGEILILAKSRLEAVLGDVDYETIKEGIKGSELVGLTYEPICATIEVETKLKDTWSVLGGDFVSDADGTGIVHIAPAYGEDDYKLAQEHAVDFVDVLDEYGYYLPEVAEKLHELGVRDTDERGIEIWAGNKFIAKCLEQKGIVWKIEYIRHEYPFNPRSKQRIMYRAFPSWFFDVQGQKELMLAQNENINWFPGYLKEGRFKKNIEQAPDWNLSRDRFWATAMPVWKGDKGTVKVVGSYDELYELSGVRLEDYHRPWVDNITFQALAPDVSLSSDSVSLSKSNPTGRDFDPAQPGDNPQITKSSGAGVGEVILPYHEGDEIPEGYHLEHFKRIDKVLDCWFESGSMPFAQLHYPFENKEKFERNYPADFIVEYVGQVRAWFYYVHCVNVALASVNAFGTDALASSSVSSSSTDARFAHGMSNTARSNAPVSSNNLEDHREVFDSKGKRLNAFKNVITTGTLAGNDGRKMSKSLGNYTDPNELMDQYSADALRFLLLSSPVLSGEDFALTDKDVSDVNRKLAMIWNVYDFFVIYAEVDGWERPGSSSSRISSSESATAPSQGDKPSSVRCSTLPRTSSKMASSLDGKVNTPDSGHMTIDEHWQGELKNPLDIWIIARLHELKRDVMAGMEEYNIPRALSGVLPFVDDLSNWFVRRSRRRFWKSEDDADKTEAYWTLWKVLTNLAKIMAPFTPFLAEELWQNLTGDWDPEKSVHLQDFPTTTEIDEQSQKVLHEMARVREVIAEGLMLRMRRSEDEQQVKVRQPLAKLVYTGEKLPDWGEEIVREEVNVKIVEQGAETWIDKEITGELAEEGFARELIRAIQSARKKADLQVDDRIRLSVNCEIPQRWVEMVKNEVLATEIIQDGNFAYDEIVKVNGQNVTVSLEKAQ